MREQKMWDGQKKAGPKGRRGKRANAKWGIGQSMGKLKRHTGLQECETKRTKKCGPF